MRRKNDFYSTPEGLTYALLDARQDIVGDIYEPCAGKGDMVGPLKTKGSVTTADIDQNCTVDWFGDARTFWPPNYTCDWVVTNPPFNMAGEIVYNTLGRLHDNGSLPIRKGIAMLLRISFLEPTKNRQWLSHLPPSQLIYLPRTSFTGDGKMDSTTCAWMIWDKTLGKKYPLGPIRVYTRNMVKMATLMATLVKQKTPLIRLT